MIRNVLKYKFLDLGIDFFEIRYGNIIKYKIILIFIDKMEL